MDYDPKGNITKKGDVGTFHYQTPYKPYALSGADIGTNKVIPPREQTIRYTSFDRPSVITENGYEASFIYNASGDRQKMTVKKGGKPFYTRYYLGGRYETDVMGNSQKHRLYIGGDAYTAPAVYMNTGNGWALYYICRDYLGNMTHLVASNGTVVQELSYDAWGRLRNPETHAVYLPDNETELMLGRGYTGHEHLSMFGLINMNARLYDPVLGRFLSPDPYVQMPDFTQSFNRYSYCLNNPLVYVDQDGEIAWFVPVIVGAVIGAYSGGVIANEGQYNPVKWDYNSGKTWGYMLGGAVVGGISGSLGWAVSISGMPMANTAGIISASFVNSVGTHIYTGGQTPVSMSLGVASYDFTNGSFGHLGKKGNKWYENLGYGLGAMANLSDILIGFKPQKVDLVTENSDAIGHSAIVKHDTRTGIKGKTDINGLISVGPDRVSQPDGSWHWMKGTNKWSTYSAKENSRWMQSLDVNYNTINRYSNWLNKMENTGKLVYSLELSSCVTHTSLALNASGVFNIGIHPYLLHAQMYLWGNGIRPWSFNHFFNR